MDFTLPPETLDTLHPCHSRSSFLFPKHSDGTPSIYLCGNSLGLQPQETRELINQELDVWADR